MAAVIYDANGNQWASPRLIGFHRTPSSVPEASDASFPVPAGKIPSWVTDEGNDQAVAARETQSRGAR